jgi:hypothetical protein
MSISTVVLLVTVYFVLSLLSLYWAMRVIRRQRNEDLRWHRDSLLAHMRLEQATHR